MKLSQQIKKFIKFKIQINSSIHRKLQHFIKQNITILSNKTQQNMSITQTNTEQLQLYSIISISETKLINNFSILNKKITKHDQMLRQVSTQIENNQNNVFHRINMVENNANSQITSLKQQLNQILNQLKNLQQNQSKHQQNIQKNQTSFLKLNDELFNTQLQFEQKHQLQQNIFNEVQQRIQQIDKQIEIANDQISKKQSKVQVERVVKDIQHLKEKDTHFEAQIKLNQHKIEKIEIINQKNQRLQAKRDIEFMKEIQDKVKRQVKVTLKGITLPNGTSILPVQQSESKTSLPANNANNANNNSPKMSISMSSSDKQNHLNALQDERKSSIRRRIPINIQEDENLLGQLLKSNIDNPLSKINERLNKLQVQQKDVNEIIKTNKFKKDDKNDTTGNIKDKINELKPQVVKLWAKFDTLEDRLAFNEKKMDEKSKILNDLVSQNKENNWGKMDEKLKNLQTQIYTNIKDIRGKLDSKVNLPDYEKFVNSLEERIKQINELIYLKSDKLQVKKALLFLESKIKEIILVISEDEENEKDALLTKKQIKCISCDKQVDKFSGNTSGLKGNWDSLPYKDQAPETLGRFGMTSYGSLAKKLKKLQGKDLPVLNNKRSNFANSTNPTSP